MKWHSNAFSLAVLLPLGCHCYAKWSKCRVKSKYDYGVYMKEWYGVKTAEVF